MVAMRALVMLLVASGATAAAVEKAAAKVTPLQKVLSLLDDMQAKGKKEKHAEEVEFAEYAQFCDSTRKATTKSIDEAKSQIEQLTADIAKAEADAEQLSTEISELDAAVAQAEGELSEATAVREKEHTDYSATHTDLSESIDAIDRAISVLKSREADTPQSLLQVSQMTGLPKEAKATIDSFLAMASDDGIAAPAANAYENQSGGVVGILEGLRHKFQDQLMAVQKAEMNAKANFEMLAQNLKDNILEDKKRSTDKTATKAQRLENAAVAKADLATTESGKAEDEKKLADTLTACHAKSVEFEKNQVVRSEEVNAIEQAMAILQSDEVSGSADKYLPKLIQTAKRGTALVQLRGGESPQESQRRERLTTFLNGRAQALGSHYLALVATHASADPFSKVKKMIKDLIVKLMEQANSEADHKAYCDTELATNKLTRENKQSEVEELSASVDKHVAESAQLTEELALLADGLAELRKEQSEATAIRQEEKATNALTVTDAKAAQVAVERATKVLRDFYEKSAGAALLQEPYTGMQSEHGGIVGFLEVILSDFARLETETSTAEDQAASAYEKFMDETNADVAVKTTESDHKTAKKRDVDAETESLKKELELTQEELDAANAYYDKLKPDCVDNGLSYTDRVRMREEEIQSMKEALNILDQQDLV
eukprot:CAMPEP_0177172856 /NCGR_PEP_ID=MMETSP0367-20130122/11356_1 /TAXON_ID=447022 ORGANISM="Scrippsiella hangoei-like, Strain SHHI-4" /NCGR_SAMPLE_ID=MMETSP0367 /ASSEMBLY_ACC=CAM_ASM_000362 /LENGTH=661 /DNA_ID=CAMNT_0018619151 /DNA_START=59 /DNA_END=2044 /DNA_ORIENTATION=+